MTQQISDNLRMCKNLLERIDSCRSLAEKNTSNEEVQEAILTVDREYVSLLKRLTRNGEFEKYHDSISQAHEKLESFRKYVEQRTQENKK